MVEAHSILANKTIGGGCYIRPRTSATLLWIFMPRSRTEGLCRAIVADGPLTFRSPNAAARPRARSINCARGSFIAPVTIEGRAIATTFWGKAWCTNLESYGDYESRLPRGRTYVFMMFAQLQGCGMSGNDRHAALDYAKVLKQSSETHFPAAKKIALVQDNLSTDKPGSLNEAFPAEEARRLVERFEWHYTPKHGSWLDMAESELVCCLPSVSIGVFQTNRH